MRFHLNSTAMSAVVLASALALGAVQARTAQADCKDLPHHGALQDALAAALVEPPDNAGLGNEMWATIVDRDGIVCAVAFSGADRGDQWPGSRVISAQKANTGNAFSLDAEDGAGIALSSGNLYGTVLEQGSLFGLQFSNPVDPAVAYGPNPRRYGQPNDPLVGQFIGGINVFGGGLALYNSDQQVVGGLGVSGDTSCTDHVVAWRVRDALGLDFVPGGVGPNGPDGTDNLNIIAEVEPSTFQHPDCGGGVADIIADLTTEFPIGGDE